MVVWCLGLSAPPIFLCSGQLRPVNMDRSLIVVGSPVTIGTLDLIIAEGQVLPFTLILVVLFLSSTFPSSAARGAVHCTPGKK